MPRQKSTRRENGQYEYKATVGKTVQGKPIRKSFYSSKSVADAKAKAKKERKTVLLAILEILSNVRKKTQIF